MVVAHLHAAVSAYAEAGVRLAGAEKGRRGVPEGRRGTVTAAATSRGADSTRGRTHRGVRGNRRSAAIPAVFRRSVKRPGGSVPGGAPGGVPRAVPRVCTLPPRCFNPG